MGTDRYVILGRIKRQVNSDTSKTTELDLIKDQIQFGDIVLQKCPDTEQPHRNYYINSFLGDHYHGCYLKSLVEPRKLAEQTQLFLDWLSNESIKAARNNGTVPKRQSWDRRPPVYDEKDFYDEFGVALAPKRRYFYPVEVLLSFDYSQVAMVGDKDNEDSETIPDPGGVTYLQKLESSSWRDKCGWEKFLTKLRTEEWDFVIFSFDS